MSDADDLLAALARIEKGGAPKYHQKNAETGKLLETYKGHKDEVRCVAFGSDGRSFASGGKDRTVCLYELEHKEIDAIPEVHLSSIESIALMSLPVLSEEGRLVKQAVLTGGADQTMRLSTIDKDERGRIEPKKMRFFRNHVQPISGVLFNDQSFGLIASSSWDGTIKLYDLDHERFTFIGHQGPVRAIVLAGDQSFLASAGNDGTIRIWRAAAR